MSIVKIKNTVSEHLEALKLDKVLLLLAMCGLQLKYLFHVLKNGEESDFDKVLRGYTTVVSRMNSIPGFDEDDEEWRSAVNAVRTALPDSSDMDDFAAAGMNILSPFLSYAALMPEMKREWFGCFCYNYNPERRHVYLHFQNACVPESPFAMIGDRFRELAMLVNDIKLKGIEPETIGCDSWINGLDVFQRFFPSGYPDSFIVSPPDSKSGYGWWGQFVGKDGRFNRKKAEQFEKTMEFQYKRMITMCSYESFVRHIGDNLRES